MLKVLTLIITEKRYDAHKVNAQKLEEMSRIDTQSISSRLLKYMEQSMSFNIQGSLAIRVIGGDVKFLLYPANAYLSPDKSCAVLYQALPEKAELIMLTNGYLELDYVATTEFIGLLSQIALQNKTVVLTVNCAEKNTITGFTYPAQRA